MSIQHITQVCRHEVLEFDHMSYLATGNFSLQLSVSRSLTGLNPFPSSRRYTSNVDCLEDEGKLSGYVLCCAVYHSDTQ